MLIKLKSHLCYFLKWDIFVKSSEIPNLTCSKCSEIHFKTEKVECSKSRRTWSSCLPLLCGASAGIDYTNFNENYSPRHRAFSVSLKIFLHVVNTNSIPSQIEYFACVVSVTKKWISTPTFRKWNCLSPVAIWIYYVPCKSILCVLEAII